MSGELLVGYVLGDPTPTLEFGGQNTEESRPCLAYTWDSLNVC